MKKLLIFILVLIFATWIGLLLQADLGYMLITYGHWTLETPLWLAILILFVVFISLHLFFNTIDFIFNVSTYMRRSLQQRAYKKMISLTNQGVMALGEEDWGRAENKFLHALKFDNSLLVNFLAAATAAYAQEDPDTAESYLLDAEAAVPKAKITIALIRAKLYLKQGNHEHALIVLQNLYRCAPSHRMVLRLLFEYYVNNAEWSDAEKLLPRIYRYKMLQTFEIEKLEKRIYEGIMDKAALELDNNAMNKVWKKLPRHLQNDIGLIKKYTKYLIHNNQLPEAESIIRNTLKLQWDESLVLLYGCIITNKLDHQLKTAESWLFKHPKDDNLFLTLGRLCLRQQLWGKAGAYLEQSLALNPQPHTYWLLAQLHERLAKPDLASQYYRQGLSILKDQCNLDIALHNQRE